MIYSTTLPSPLGIITLASDGKHLTGLWFQGQKHFPDTRDMIPEPSIVVFHQTEDWLRRYFALQAPDPQEIPLAPVGTDFQQRVWEKLQRIPYGQVTTYGELARQLGCRSARAVGNAVGRNPISILIPCHRVVGKNGSLTGYAGGLDRKQQLLHIENTP